MKLSRLLLFLLEQFMLALWNFFCISLLHNTMFHYLLFLCYFSTCRIRKIIIILSNQNYILLINSSVDQFQEGIAFQESYWSSLYHYSLILIEGMRIENSNEHLVDELIAFDLDCDASDWVQ